MWSPDVARVVLRRSVAVSPLRPRFLPLALVHMVVEVGDPRRVRCSQEQQAGVPRSSPSAASVAAVGDRFASALLPIMFQFSVDC